MKQAVDMEYVHYITGNPDNFTTKTKAGCGLFSENCRTSVHWKSRQAVTCPDCMLKIEQIERMHESKSSGKRLTPIDKMYKPFSNF